MADTPDKSLRGKSVMPTLTVDDLSQSLTFFRGLGFEIEDRWEDNGVLMGAKLRVGFVLRNVVGCVTHAPEPLTTGSQACTPKWR